MTCSTAMGWQCMPQPYSRVARWTTQVDGSKYTGQFWCDKHHGDGVEVGFWHSFSEIVATGLAGRKALPG